MVQVAAYYIAAMFASQDGAFPVLQPDTLLYCQAARRICEGAPFSFSLGTAPSTGTTSVLYPFFLAIPYAAGFTGDSLIAAGFWLNAACYLVFLLGWTSVFIRWIEDVRTRMLGIVLLALLGQPAFCAMAQSDIGLLLAVTSLIFATAPDFGSVNKLRDIAFALLLIIAPWVRPEGMMIVLAFGAVYGIRFLSERTPGNFAFVAVRGILPLISVFGVFALNYYLTGMAQFASVAYKGYFKNYDLAPAMMQVFKDGWTMFKALVLALPDNIPRCMFSIPLAGGVVLVIGIFVHPWRRNSVWSEAMLMLAAGLSFASVANSQTQGSNVDRYLAWIFPVFVLFTAEGASFLYRRLSARRIAALVPLAFIGYFAVASFTSCCVFCDVSRRSDRIRHFGKACEEMVPKGATLGGNGHCGIAYFMSPRKFVHIGGLYSPEYEVMEMEERIDDLKHNPDLRFDYWCLKSDYMEIRTGSDSDYVFGPRVLVGAENLSLYRADWSAYDAAAEAPRCEDGESLIARVDVGYPPDERAAGYRAVDRWYRKPAQPFIRGMKNQDGRRMVDVGRLVTGADEMSLKVRPGKDIRVVMRQCASANSVIDESNYTTESICVQLPAEYSITVSVDGNVLPKVPLTCPKTGFSDVSFVIPGAFVRQDEVRIAFLGDHIPFGYWFYQKAD